MAENNDKPRIIETASATTSKDNENSGPFAYIITGVSLGILLVLTLLGTGCTSLVLASLAADSGSSSNALSFPYDDLEKDLDTDLEDLLERYYSNPNGSSNKDSKSSQESGFAEVADVLDFSLAPYGSSIDNEVSANSYAGTPAEVRDFVRNISETDEEYTRQLVVLLDNAAKKEDERTAKIQEAKQLCSDARDAIDKIEVPKLEQDQNGDVAFQLESGKTEAIKRWENMADEIAMLDTTSTVNTKDLWSIDDKVVDATSNAGDKLESAMDAASKL